MKTRLTQTVQKGGCAAKISAEVLREVLGKLDFSTQDPNVLVDGKDFDDAGIYQVTPEIALVQTLDFFTPIVDTPFLFGQIAAVNALSDVYAMGGIPKTCMAILAFPLATLDPEIMGEIMAGAQSKIKEAKASLVGGHSIDDDTIKFGLSVTGLVNPKRMWTNKNAKPGNHLILTKGLGTGTLTAGLKNSDYTEAQIQEALDSMTTLNHILDLLTDEEQKSIQAATDITGFGLLGHAMQMAKASQVSFKISFPSLPILNHALDSLKADNLTKAHRTNFSYTKDQVRFLPEFHQRPVSAPSMKETDLQILYDPQTSGGLLLSVDPKYSDNILTKLKTRFQKAAIIGEVIARGSHCVEVNQ